MKSWIHKVAHQDGEEDLAKKTNAKKINTKPTLVEEASASAAKTVASYVARASQEMVSKTEGGIVKYCMNFVIFVSMFFCFFYSLLREDE